MRWRRELIWRTAPSRKSLITSAADKLTKKGDKKEDIEFQEFVNIVLKAQIRFHSQFLKVVRDEFQEVDVERIGWLAPDSFSLFINALDQEGQFEADDFLSSVDKHQTGVITFSSVVDLFSRKYVQSNGKQITLLQFFNDYFS